LAKHCGDFLGTVGVEVQVVEIQPGLENVQQTLRSVESSLDSFYLPRGYDAATL
jgi:hypothetical protein